MHTHFASGTFSISAFLGVVILGSFWKLAWLHAGSSRNPTVRALSAAALFQYN